MDAAHLHLLTNHFPIIGSFFVLGLLAYGLLFKDAKIGRAGLVALFFVGLMTIPAFYSGEGAEDIVEQYSVPESLVEIHEEWAAKAFIMMMATAVIGLVVLIWEWKRKKAHRLAKTVVLVLMLGVIGLMAITGNKGGEIRHPEIRKSVVSPANTPNDNSGAGGDYHHDDDDD